MDIDTLDKRRSETWVGTRHVTLVKGDTRVRGTRMGRFGGVSVGNEAIAQMGLPGSVPPYRNDFRPPFYAELSDSAWSDLGWTIYREAVDR